MNRADFDQTLQVLRAKVQTASSRSLFPLDVALRVAIEQKGEREALIGSHVSADLAQILVLLDITSTGASLAIKQLGKVGDDTTGIRDALVDLWGRCEAARCLWFDTQQLFTGEEAKSRIEDLWETAKLVPPDAIAIAMRLSETVAQYVEFASKVIALAPPPAA